MSDAATMRVLDALMSDARRCVHTIAASDALQEVRSEDRPRVAMTTAYTTGFEAGLAIAVSDRELGRRVLAAIDREMLGNDPRATVHERAEYIDHYRQALGLPHGG